jgi:acyl carrier protein
MTDRTAILRKLLDFLESDTDIKVDQVNEEVSLREGLGLDSVDLVGIIMRIEGHYHIRMSHAELEQVGTVADLLDVIQSKVRAGGAPGVQAA